MPGWRLARSLACMPPCQRTIGASLVTNEFMTSFWVIDPWDSEVGGQRV